MRADITFGQARPGAVLRIPRSVVVAGGEYFRYGDLSRHFISYVERFWPALGEGPLGVAVGVALIATCALVNLLGSKSIGDGSAVMTAALLLPFVILTFVLFARADVSAQPSEPAASGDWLGGILIAMWNYMGSGQRLDHRG